MKYSLADSHLTVNLFISSHSILYTPSASDTVLYPLLLQALASHYQPLVAFCQISQRHCVAISNVIFWRYFPGWRCYDIHWCGGVLLCDNEGLVTRILGSSTTRCKTELVCVDNSCNQPCCRIFAILLQPLSVCLCVCLCVCLIQLLR